MVRTIAGWYRRAYEGLPREIWIIAFALFVNRFGTMVLPFLSLYLQRELGYGEATIGRILSVYGLGSICGVFLCGRSIRAVGAVRIQIILFLLACPICWSIPHLRSLAGVTVGLFLLAAFSEGVRPANHTAIANFAPRDLRVRAFGLQRMALNLGISFGPAIGGFLSQFGFAWLFIVDGATTFLCGIVLLMAFGLRRYTSGERRAHEPENSANGRSPLSDVSFVCFLGLVLATSIVFFQFHITFPLYLAEHYHLSNQAIGGVFAVNTIVIVFAEMILLDWVRRWDLLGIIGVGAALSCIGFGLLPYGRSGGYAVVVMLVITLGEMLWMPLASGWIAYRSERGDQGQYMSWYTVTFSVAGMIAPTVGGTLYEWRPDSFWHAALGLSVVVWLGFACLRRHVRGEEPARTAAAVEPGGIAVLVGNGQEAAGK